MEKTELDGPNGGVLIRDFRKSDLSRLLELLPACFAKEFDISGFDPEHVTHMVDRAFGRTGTIIRGLLRLFGKEPVKFLVAETNGTIVGTTIINDRGKFGYISSVMVHPDCRGKGIATKLMRNALDYIRKKKKARAVLHVDSANAAAKSIYLKLGFKAFERLSYFLKETNSAHLLESASEVRIREFQKHDLDQVYNLVEASEDSNSLRIFGFTKKDLKTPFLQRMFRFAAQKRLVAVLGNRIVGYAETSYTTPKEAGRIWSIHVSPEHRLSHIERLLIEAAKNEIVEGGARRVRITIPTAKQQLIETVKGLGFKEVLVMDAMVAEFQ